MIIQSTTTWLRIIFQFFIAASDLYYSSDLEKEDFY